MRYPDHAYVQFKTDVVRLRTTCLCDTAYEVLYEMAEYCEERSLPFTITDSVSTVEEDRALKRVSDEHSQGRAFDVSIKGWNAEQIRAFTVFFERRFISVAAIGKKTGEPRLIFVHNAGFGAHIHVQVARLYGLKDPLKRLDLELPKVLKA